MKALRRLWIVSFLLLCSYFSGNAQDIIPQDSTSTNSSEPIQPVHSPKKAAYLSILPGLGQVYNKKYWKVPIIYGALGTTAYYWVHNNNKYQMYREAYGGRVDQDTTNNLILPEYGTEDLRQLKNYYWKYRDMSALIFLGIWALNILDATVDAHLYTFNINDDLSMRIQPNMEMPMGFGKSPSYGLSIALKF